MQIQDIQVYPLTCALATPFAYSQKWFSHRTATLVRVTTDQGLCGWGEVFCHDGWPAVVALLEQVYKPLVVGKDPLAHQVIWETLYSWTRDYGQKGLTTAALSGLDIALWDLAGKATGLPISKLLGGNFRDRVQAYATGLYQTQARYDSTPALVEEATGYVELGFQAVKLKVGFGLRRDTQNVAAVRNAIGPDIGLMIDANHAYDPASAIALAKAVERYDIAWFEEPVIPEDVEGYRTVRQAISIPVAGGEAEFTRYGFRHLIAGQAVDIVQPDLCICGGISEGRKILALAQAWSRRLVPHVWGTGIALATALHFIAAQPDHPPSLNALPCLLEFDRTENPLRDEILTEPLHFENGTVAVPDGPGLGITVDETILRRYRIS